VCKHRACTQEAHAGREGQTGGSALAALFATLLIYLNKQEITKITTGQKHSHTLVVRYYQPEPIQIGLRFTCTNLKSHYASLIVHLNCFIINLKHSCSHVTLTCSTDSSLELGIKKYKSVQLHVSYATVHCQTHIGQWIPRMFLFCFAMLVVNRWFVKLAKANPNRPNRPKLQTQALLGSVIWDRTAGLFFYLGRTAGLF